MPDQVPFDLPSLKWKRRPLLIFAANDNDPDWQIQRDRMDQCRHGMRERQMARVEVLGDHDGRVKQGRLTREAIASLRRRFDVPTEQFSVILVGKDGTEKMRSQTPVSMEDVFDRIDAMPIRRREMRDESTIESNGLDETNEPLE